VNSAMINFPFASKLVGSVCLVVCTEPVEGHLVAAL
jgi:hypothetical protein